MTGGVRPADIHALMFPILTPALLPPLPSYPTEPDRKYFTQVADGTPDDTLLLTLGCGKFR